MRFTRLLSLLTILPLAACELDLTGIGSPDEPTDLTYELLPSGDPDFPLGVVLTWNPPRDGYAVTYDVFGRGSAAGEWQLRATTTSPSFHDAGVPQVQYYVLARDGNGEEMGRSDVITIDERDRLPSPDALSSISLDGAVHLSWARNAVDADPVAFDHYRVYSALYDAPRGQCADGWSLEGTTVAEGFLALDLPNGVTRCFAVSAVSRDGHESAWSGVRTDTPRFGARNAVVYASAVRPASSAFLFYDEIGQQYGGVAASSRADADLIVERQTDGSLWLSPARGGVQLALYGTAPVEELTSIDRAPAGGYGDVRIEAVPGWGYVARMTKSDGVHYGAVRVAFTGADYVVFDWSYQSAAGNPELTRLPSPGTVGSQ